MCGLGGGQIRVNQLLIVTFRVMLYSFILEIEAVGFSETLVPSNQTTRHHML